MATARTRRSHWRNGLFVGLAGLVLLLIVDALVRDATTPRGDDRIYELMAQEPFDTHSFPFAFRLLVPTLVYLSPAGNGFDFSVLAWVSSAACGTVAYVLMRRFEVVPWLAAALALGLVLCPQMLVASLRQGRNVDPETVLVMLAGGLAVADRRPLALGVIVFLGVMVRESALFLVPFAYAYWAEGLIDRRAAVQVLGAALPAVVFYAVLRGVIPTVGGYESGLQARIDVIVGMLEGEPLTELRRIAIAFGPLWLAAPFALRDLRYARAGLVLIACCLVSFTFAGDWARVLLLAAPVIYVSAGHVLSSRRRLAIAAVVVFAAIEITYAVYMHTEGVEANIINGPLPEYPVR
jgi:hypothetical protein